MKGFILDLVIGRIIVSVIIWIVSALLFSVLCVIIAPAIRMRASPPDGDTSLIAAFSGNSCLAGMPAPADSMRLSMNMSGALTSSDSSYDGILRSAC